MDGQTIASHTHTCAAIESKHRDGQDFELVGRSAVAQMPHDMWTYTEYRAAGKPGEEPFFDAMLLHLLRFNRLDEGPRKLEAVAAFPCTVRFELL